MAVLWTALGLFVLSTAAWLLSVMRANANVVDQCWGIAQITVASVCLLAGETRTSRSWLCAAIVTIWGLRLTIHLTIRDRGRGEDWRHREARRSKPGFRWRSLPEIFWFQLIGGGLGVGLPMFAAVSKGQPPLAWLDAVGIILWLGGITFETIADLQLAKFRGETANRDRVLKHGLWRHSRHPNYFGELLVWVGIALIGVAAGAWWALFSPMLVAIIILRVSGVAAMDRHLAISRGQEYAEYVRTTSAIIPLPRRSP